MGWMLQNAHAAVYSVRPHSKRIASLSVMLACCQLPRPRLHTVAEDSVGLSQHFGSVSSVVFSTQHCIHCAFVQDCAKATVFKHGHVSAVHNLERHLAGAVAAPACIHDSVHLVVKIDLRGAVPDLVSRERKGMSYGAVKSGTPDTASLDGRMICNSVHGVHDGRADVKRLKQTFLGSDLECHRSCIISMHFWE